MKVLMKKVGGYKKGRMWNMASFQTRRWHREQAQAAQPNHTSNEPACSPLPPVKNPAEPPQSPPECVNPKSSIVNPNPALPSSSRPSVKPPTEPLQQSPESVNPSDPPLPSPCSLFPDTVSKLIHGRPKPASGPAHREAVNKFAVSETQSVNKSSIAKDLRPADNRSGRLAPGSSWSLCVHSKRVYRRTPADPRAPVQRS